MKKIVITVLSVIMLAALACKPNKENIINDIKKQEQELTTKEQPIPGKEKVDKLVASYFKFVEEFPKDSLAPEFLFKAGTQLMNSNQSDQAIECLQRITKDYTEFKKLPETYFLIAFIYDSYKKDINKAKDAYKQFIEKFPQSDLVDDASISLDNLGKSDDMIIEEFNKKLQEKADSASKANQQK